MNISELAFSTRHFRLGIFVALFVITWSGWWSLRAQSALPGLPFEPLPRLAIDPPEYFLRSPASDANVQWFDSTIVNLSLRIYAFRPYTGDAARAFHQNLLMDLTSLDADYRLAAAPNFGRVTMAGADAVETARFLDVNGRSHYRVLIVANGGRAVAIVHVRGETEDGYRRALPSINKVLASLRISTAPPRLSEGRGDTRTVAGLYLAPRVNLLPFPGGGPAASTYFYLFSGDGRVYRGYGMPKAPEADIRRFNYDAAAQEDPENAGIFEIQGDRLVIRMGWQSPSVITVRVPDAQGRITIENSTLTRQVR